MNYRGVASHANAMNEKFRINAVIKIFAEVPNTVIKKCLLMCYSR